MNKKFLQILSEYIPIPKTGVQFEVELKKLNISRQELADLFGVPVNTLARKFNKLNKHYKKKSKKVIEEWALYGIKCAITDIKRRAEEVKQKKLEEAKQLVNYAKGNLSNQDIILAEKRGYILEAIKEYGSDIKLIAKSLNLTPRTILKHIVNDDELRVEFSLTGEEDIIDTMKTLKDIIIGADNSNKDRISAANLLLKNTKSKLLDKDSSQPFKGPPPNNNFLINNFHKKTPEKKEMNKNLVYDKNGEEYIPIDNEEAK